MKSLLRSALPRLAALFHRPSPHTVPAGPFLRVLIIRPDHLGDVLFLTPSLRRLRVALPAASVTALVGPWAEGLLARNPDLDRVETLPFPWYDRRPKANLLAPYRLLYDAATRLRNRFDVALIARFDHGWGAWLAAAAGIPVRIGYDTPSVVPFLTHPVPYASGRHEVLQNITLIDRLVAWGSAAPLDSPPVDPAAAPLRYEITGADRLAARRLLNATALHKADGPLVAIHPGSGAPVKRWEIGKWGALMRQLHERYRCQFVITGGDAEALLAAKVAGAAGEVPAISLAGETTLPVLAALFEQCSLVVGPDSGPLHIAVAMGRPTVHLYGPVSPRTFGPWGDPRRHVVLTDSLACQYCHRLDWKESDLPEHPCVTGIPVSRVAMACGTLLEAVDKTP